MQTEKFDLWCLVELFGHQRIAGRVTEQTIGGASMLRVDVPATEKQPAFTRLFNPSAVYAINPVDEETARYYVQNLNNQPIQAWDVREMLKRNDQLKLAASVEEKGGEKGDDEDYSSMW